MVAEAMPEKADNVDVDEKIENVDLQGNLVYCDDEVEPELHWKTWVAFVSICMFQVAALSELTAVPAIVRLTHGECTQY